MFYLVECKRTGMAYKITGGDHSTVRELRMVAAKYVGDLGMLYPLPGSVRISVPYEELEFACDPGIREATLSKGGVVVCTAYTW